MTQLFGLHTLQFRFEISIVVTIIWLDSALRLPLILLKEGSNVGAHPLFSPTRHHSPSRIPLSLGHDTAMSDSGRKQTLRLNLAGAAQFFLSALVPALGAIHDVDDGEHHGHFDQHTNHSGQRSS